MVARRLSHQLVEPGVVADKDAVIVSGPAHLFQDLCELDETAIADLLRRLGRRRRLQQHANLPQLEQALVPHQVGGEPDPVQQQLRPQAGHVRPVTATDVQHTSHDQRPDRFAYCAAGAAEMAASSGSGGSLLPGSRAPRTIRSRMCSIAWSIMGAAIILPRPRAPIRAEISCFYRESVPSDAAYPIRVTGTASAPAYAAGPIQEVSASAYAAP
jgi:hypothetical protein